MVAVYQRPGSIQNQGDCKLEAGIFLHTVGIERDDGNVGKPRLLQSPADKSHIVAGPAAAACLGHEDGQTVCIVFPRGHSAHNLPHHSDRGEASVVVHKLQAHINGRPIVVVQNLHMVPVTLEHRLQQGEVDGRHLRRQNGPAFPLHLPGVHRTAVGSRLGVGHHSLPGPHIHGRQQAPDPNPGCTQVGHLINFEDGVQLAAGLQNLRHLIGGYGVQTAAKGVELNELQVLPGPDKLRRRV